MRGDRKRMRRRNQQKSRQWPLVLLAVLLLAGSVIFFVRQIPRASAPPEETVERQSTAQTEAQTQAPPAQIPEAEDTPQPSVHDPGWEKHPTPSPADETGGEEAEQEQAPQQAGDWQLLLVNRDHPLTEQAEIETVTLSCGEIVDARIYPALQQMFDDMRQAGVYPVVASGYRTEEDQQRIYDERVAQYVAEGYTEQDARAETEKWVALPGTSEHQTGLAVDINADGVNSYGYEVYDWLDAHAHEYGFIQRYPEDKTDITGVSNEPWHYRYVGEEAAFAIWQSGICLEEYLNAA